MFIVYNIILNVYKIILSWFYISEYQHTSDSEGDATNVRKVDQAAVDSFLSEWGIDKDVKTGGLLVNSADKAKDKEVEVPRKVYLLQRKEGKLGAGLGKTTGWNLLEKKVVNIFIIYHWLVQYIKFIVMSLVL